jgi:hypothetical protein
MNARRWALVAVIIAVVAIAASAGSATAHKMPAVATPANAASIDPDAPGSVWFCPGPPDASMLAADTITVANVGATAATIVTTARPDHEAPPMQRSFTVAPYARVERTRKSLGPLGALTVESFGGEVAVEENLSSPNQVAGGPCATNAARHWYFAAGTTPRATHQWLIIDDPYATDAKVNVTIRTSDGTLRPDNLQALDIGRRTRVVVAIDKYAVLKERVAVQVDADPQLGRVVASQMLQAPNGTVAGTVGTPTTSDHWIFPGPRTAPDRTTWVAITNPGITDARVTVLPVTSTNNVVAPVSVSVAPDAIVWVQIGACTRAGAAKDCANVASGVRYALDVRADEGAQVVAQIIERGPNILAASLGVITPATTWILPVSGVDAGEVSTRLSIFNGQASRATVNIALQRHGAVVKDPALQNIVIPPGRGVEVVVAVPSTRPSTIFLTSDIPVAVDRRISATGDAAVSPGIPVG